MSKKLRIVFMGTPLFAVESLDILLQNNYDIAAVVTAPDKPAGRGRKLSVSAVKAKALEHHIPILQPIKFKDEQFLEELKNFQANLFIVVAFRMLPETVWSIPEYGTFNLHASLLPQYRGAAPINWAVINGEVKTGVTTFFIEHQIDTGDILLSEEVEILDTDNASSLHNKLMKTGAELVLTTVKGIEFGTLTPVSQPQNAPIKPAPKIFKEDCLLDFSQEVTQVHNKVRGLAYYPGAFTFLEGKNLKIFKTEVQVYDDQIEPGVIETDEKSYMRIKCRDGWLNILELQLEGKKRMSIADFLRGYNFPNEELSIG